MRYLIFILGILFYYNSSWAQVVYVNTEPTEEGQQTHEYISWSDTEIVLSPISVYQLTGDEYYFRVVTADGEVSNWYGPVSIDTRGLLNTQGVFRGDTRYQYSGEIARVCWTPPVEDWQGVFVFDFQVRHFERKQVVVEELSVSNTELSFNIPRTGHYEVLVRTCRQDNPTQCSTWASAAQGAGSSGACGAAQKEQRDWWLFAWVAAPTFPN